MKMDAKTKELIVRHVTTQRCINEWTETQNKESGMPKLTYEAVAHTEKCSKTS